VDLGDRILGAPAWPVPVGTRQKVRLPDRFQNQLERGLHHTIPHGRDAQPAPLATAGLWDRPLPHGHRTKRPGLQVNAKIGKERVHPMVDLDGVGGLAVHAGRAGALVAPHPPPCHQQDGGITDEVEQLTKPT
jgi:hypothetical protein